MRACYCLLLPLLLLSRCQEPEADAPEAFGPIPTESQLNWQRMETNAFLHFTTNTFTDLEWGYGDEPEEIFNPTDLDVDQWISVLADAGMKGAILTSKHHDGFALWPSAYTEHSVKNSPWKEGNGDLVGEVAAACRDHDLKFGIYLSPWDRNQADYGKSEYVTYYRNQLREIYENYGPIFEMWFDGANGGDGYYGGANEKRAIDGRTYYDWPGTIDLVRELQPEPKVIIFSDAGPDIRWVGNERGEVSETNWNTITPDTLYAGQAGIGDLLGTGTPGGSTWMPAEVDVSIRPGWFYHASQDDRVKTPEELFEIYLTSVGRGSVLLLNVPPDRRGRIHETDVAALQGWRKLIDSTFSNDLAAGRAVSATAQRGGGTKFAPDKLTDGDRDTYWATDDGVTTASLTVNLGERQPIRYVELAEYIQLGQRITDFTVEGWVDGVWKTIGTGTTVGYKRILPVESVETDQIRVTIDGALAAPTLSRLSVF